VYFYLLQCVYLGFSGLQIRDGYPPFREALGRTGGAAGQRGYGPAPFYLFKGFMLVPFLFELKSLLDWCNAVTSLDVWMWLQVEEAYAMLYLVCCNMQYRREDALILRGHRPQPTLRKATSGALIFGALLTLLVAPMVLFSSANPKLVSNPVLRASASLTLVDSRLGDRYAVFSTEDLALSAGAASAADAAGNAPCGGVSIGGGSSSINGATTDAAAVLAARNANAAASAVAARTTTIDLETFTRAAGGRAPAKLPQYSSAATLIQFVQFHPYAPTLWAITPPAKEDLRVALNNSAARRDATRDDFRWELQLQFTRAGPTQAARMQWDASRPLNWTDSAQLAAFLLARSNASVSLPLDAMTRPLLYLGTSGEPQWACADGFASRANATVDVDESGSAFWKLAGAPAPSSNADGADPFCSSAAGTASDEFVVPIDCGAIAAALSPPQVYYGGLCMVVVSPGYPAVLGGFLSGLAGYGVVALYVIILGTIASAVRQGLLGNATTEIVFTEMPDTALLLGLCEGIYIARAEAYHGHLKDEVRLFETLLKLLRSPDMLLRLTGGNAIHLPAPRPTGAVDTDLPGGADGKKIKTD